MYTNISCVNRKRNRKHDVMHQMKTLKGAEIRTDVYKFV